MKIDNIKEYYKEWWENPSDPRSVVFERLNSYVRSRIPVGKDKKALDLGSGKGRIVGYLLEEGYRVTAVEFSHSFTKLLKQRFPEVGVVECDVRNFKSQQVYDLVTCIELVQNLEKHETLGLLRRLRPLTKKLMISISNNRSLHGKWVKWRRFQAEFVYDYSPEWLDRALLRAGFRILHRRGIGLLTPLTFWKGFRGRFVPICFARLVNFLFDRFFTNYCHLYYVEAE